MEAEKKAERLKIKRRHFELKHIETHVRTKELKEYPSEIKDWGQKSNFRRACKKFSIVNGEFAYDNKRVVIIEKKTSDGNYQGYLSRCWRE